MSSKQLDTNVRLDKDLMIASHIIDRNFSEKKGKKDSNNNEIQPERKHRRHSHIFNPTSSITPYILLIALSLHGIFEGIALGVINNLKECSFLFLAIILHKWAESFALGISFYKSGTEQELFIKMIIIFSSFGPLGIIIGMIFSYAGNLITGIMLSFAGGTFIYVSASEIIVEEFSLSKKTNIKYLWFLIGGFLTYILTFIE